MGGRFKLPFGELTVTFNETDLIWAGYRMKDFIPAADVEVRGLRNRYRTQASVPRLPHQSSCLREPRANRTRTFHPE
jgi:hypothetical protein